MLTNIRTSYTEVLENLNSVDKFEVSKKIDT